MSTTDPVADRQAKIQAHATKDHGKIKVIIGAILAVLLVGGVGFALVKAGQTEKQLKDGGQPKSALGPDQGYVLNAAKVKPGAPTLDIYEDFQCPICKKVHDVTASAIKELSDNGDAKVVVHIMNFLDSSLGNDSSTKAGNAAACADDQGKFKEFHAGVFAVQPEREGDGYSDAALENAATKAGIAGEGLETWKKCVKLGTYKNFVAKVEARANKDGITGTPSFRIAGKEWKWQPEMQKDPKNPAIVGEALKKAVLAAKK